MLLRWTQNSSNSCGLIKADRTPQHQSGTIHVPHAHMFVYLVVGAVLLLALAALQQVSGGAASFGHLVFPYGLLGESVSQLLQLVAGHFLHKDRGVKRWRTGDRVMNCSGLAATPRTSADMEAMRLNSIDPARTFLRSPGFFGSFRLLIRLRTLFLYFMSVALISW